MSPVLSTVVMVAAVAATMERSQLTTLNWKSRAWVASSVPPRYSSAQIPTTYWPSTSGRPLSRPVTGSMARAGAASMG